MMSQFERFGKYILLEKLAAGGMAEIYLAKSLGAQGVNKFLAVKRILPQFCENPEFKEMFREEAKLSVNLRHSNVVPIFDFGEERNQFYIVMDYVEGRNLRQILNELKRQQIQFSVEQIAYVIREAAAGLDHAHRCIDGSTGRPLNIIHRDISPQNVMISFDGEVKIIDFGIAKAETQMEATKAGTLKGKFGYMSPEQADGQNIDVRTDIFSLGIVLWELLANDRLFTASSEAAILRKIRDCQVPSIRKINPNVPPELEKIVNKVLAKDPNLRYQTAAALHKDLNRFLNTQFPDFNSQDFAVFIKNAFAQSYQESKRKLVEYAKVQNPDDKTVVTTQPPVQSAARAEATVIDHSVPPIGEDGQPLNQETNHKVDLTGLKQGQTRTNVSMSSSVTPNPKTMTGIRTGVTPPRGLPSRPSSSSDLMETLISWFVRGGVTAIFIVGGWWAWQNNVFKDLLAEKPKDESRVEQASKAPAPAPAPKEEPETLYKVTLNSDPIGARVYFEGIDQGKFTPVMVQLPARKSIHITFKKDGYYPYEIDFTPVSNAQPLQANMQPLGRAAYISVLVINGGSSPVIEINGRRVGDTNVQVYPIPAGVPVQIRARNSFTGAMAETSVSLEADQKKTVELILGAGLPR
ncbi:MAG: serine/threonine protein kinase [Bdellovibrionaceae bacterium]|nr:serine/threonine protein kinase [Pseudobdellovibrionaceae bacterium]